MIDYLPFEWRIGIRYFGSGKGRKLRHFSSSISFIAMLGIALGVAALIIVLSVMNGFQKDVTDRMLSVLAPIEIFKKSAALPEWREVMAISMRNPAVRAAAPYVEIQAMLVHAGQMRPAVIRGVRPQEELKTAQFGSKETLQSLAALAPGAFRVVLGADLAGTMGLQPTDKVTIILPKGQVTPGGVLPRVRSFVLAGTFRAGHPQFDGGLGFIEIEDAQKLMRLDAPSGLRLRIVDMRKAQDVARELRKALPPDLTVRDWSELNASWFTAVKTEKQMMFLIVAMIVAVAAFNLVSILVMTVTDKQADIAILRTLGASPRSIMKIFLIQGALVGLLGTFVGVLGGVLVSLNMDVIAPFIERLFGFQFLSKDIFLINTLPSDLHWDEVTRIGAVGVVLSLLSTLYPSRWAAKVNPAAALRYE